MKNDNGNTQAGSDCQERLVRHSLTLDEFIFEQLKSLEDFESSWRELHRKNDDIYPLEMFAGDWSGQLAVWRERADLILPNASRLASADPETPNP